jgi:hypothetical protein
MVAASHSCAQEGGIDVKVNLLGQPGEALPLRFPAVTVTGPLDERPEYLS